MPLLSTFWSDTMPSELPAKLASIVRVRSSGLRSVHVERDLYQPSLVENYVFTAQAHRTLLRIVEGLNSGRPVRTWTLTGPYGSGKSYFGLFLMQVLNTALPAHAIVMERLERAAPVLAEHIRALWAGHDYHGLLAVPITGHRAPFQQLLLRGLCEVLQPWRGHSPIAELVARAEHLVLTAPSSRAVMKWIEQVLAVVTQPPLRYNGMLVVLDEMGKPLEYAATHPNTSDIYLLQEIAELANRNGQPPFVFVGILHQSFDRYAGNLDGATQREWAKIQGRFEDIAFQEPPAQQMRLLAGAIEHDAGYETSLAAAIAKTSAQEAVAAGWLPPLMSPDEFTALCLRAYPLHPTTFVALPYVFRRLAQNERSIFAYLASQEPFGFQQFLQTKSAPDMVRLSDLFDYLVANFQGRLYASLRARPLTETLERLANGHELSPLAEDLVKSIGLLNWLGEVSPMQASEERLLAAVRSPERTDDQIRKTLHDLQTRSYVVYRRFNRTYTIWQGSDVDIEERLDEARQRLTGPFSLAQVVHRYLPPRSIVARRHSYQSGTLRYFEVRYVDQYILPTLQLQPALGAAGLILLCLPLNHGEHDAFVHWATGPVVAQRPDVLVGIVERIGRLVELIDELRSLQWVRENTPALRDDPVARRELRARLSTVENLIRSELDRFLLPGGLSTASGCTWFRLGAQVPNVLNISSYLSAVCDELYPQAPRLWNELLNRRTLSSQGAAARRNLIEAMLTRSEQPILGIEGYPPERSMYESLLRAGGLHGAFPDGTWRFTPPPEDDPLRLEPTWKAISDFIFAIPPEPRSVQELFERLSAPPYGLTAGVMPVLLCAFLLAHRDETTLYREGTLLPEPSVADWEVLLRRPELFAVAGCRVTGLRAAVVERMARGLRTTPHVMPVVRAIIGRLKALPEHAWRTRRLPDTALALRRVVEQARSPERFLFVELPEALNLPAFDEDEFDQERFDTFFKRLNGALEALANATPRLLTWARDTWLTACGLPTGEAGWELFRQEAAQLAPRVSEPTLAPMLKRAVGAADSQSALESVLALLANRPLSKWTDADSERFQAQAQHVGKLWQQASQELRDEAHLTQDDRQRVEALVDEMERVLARYQERPEIVSIAISVLRRRLQEQALTRSQSVI